MQINIVFYLHLDFVKTQSKVGGQCEAYVTSIKEFISFIMSRIVKKIDLNNVNSSCKTYKMGQKQISELDNRRDTKTGLHAHACAHTQTHTERERERGDYLSIVEEDEIR